MDERPEEKKVKDSADAQVTSVPVIATRGVGRPSVLETFQATTRLSQGDAEKSKSPSLLQSKDVTGRWPLHVKNVTHDDDGRDDNELGSTCGR